MKSSKPIIAQAKLDKIKATVRFLLTTPQSDREIGGEVGVSKTTVGRYRQIVIAKNLVWSDVEHVTASKLTQLFNRDPNGNKTRQLPDFASIQERQENGYPLTKLWEDYRREDPHNTLSYSQFATRMRYYSKTQPTVMRLTHDPGFKAYVDFSGFKKIPLPSYIDAKTGKKIKCQVFVGALPATSLIFALCTLTQSVPDVIHAHQKMLAYFGGMPLYLVCDNLKSIVLKSGKHCVFQPAFAEFLKHYQMAANPARVYRPKDKATVETSVGIVQNEITLRLNERTHYSLEELNASMAVLLDELNKKPMEDYLKSRFERFETMERHLLQPLPAEPYVYAQWTHVIRVPKDYHVRVDRHCYSVPNALSGQPLTVRLAADTVAFFSDTQQVACHPRSFEVGGHTTDPAHQTADHRKYAERNLEHMHVWARKAGPHVFEFIRSQMRTRHRAKAIGVCDEVKALADKHGTLAVNEAAREAIHLNAVSLTTLRRMLNKQSDPSAPMARPRNRYVPRSKAPVLAAKGVAC